MKNFTQELLQLQLQELLKNIPQSTELFVKFDHNNYHLNRTLALVNAADNQKYKVEFLEGDYARPVLVSKKTRIVPWFQLDLNNIPIASVDASMVTRNILVNAGPISSKIDSNIDTSTTSNHEGRRDSKRVKKSQQKYSNEILKDALAKYHSEYISEVTATCKSLQECILLLRHWLILRDFGNRQGYVLDYKWAGLICCYLFKSKKLKNSYSCMQMFKLTIKYLSELDFQLNYLTDDGKQLVKGFDNNYFLGNYENSMVGPCGMVNLLSNCSKSCVYELKYECLLTLDLLEQDKFHPVFLEKVIPELKYDNIINVPIVNENKKVLDRIYTILKQGLGERVKLLCAYTRKLPLLSLGEDYTIQHDCDNITIGLILDLQTCNNQVHFGPSSNDTEKAAEFKSLWGPKTETRRFQDGSIKEVVVFETIDSSNHKSVICARMCAYLLQRHFNVTADSVCYWAGTGLKHLKPSILEYYVLDFKEINSAYIEAQKLLRRIDLPLSINTFHVCSNTLSNTSVFVPQRMNTTSTIIQPIQYGEFLIEFENSGKWPDDVNAIETMKRAFFVKIVAFLKEDVGICAAVCLDEKNESFVELVVDGFAFKVGILQTRVGYLIQRQLKSSDDACKQLLDAYNEKYVWRNRHAAMINLLATRFGALGATCRISKRFFASQLILGKYNLPEPVVEYLCAMVFVNPGAYGVPGSGFTGFLRVLKLVEELNFDDSYNLETEPGKLTPEIQKEIEYVFKSKPKKVIYISTEYDVSGSYFAQHQIPSKIWERAIVVSRHCLKHCLKLMDFGGQPDITVNLSN